MIFSLPDFISETSLQQKMMLENDTKIIRNEFDKQLIISGMIKSTDDEFRAAFNSYCNMIINKKYEQTSFSSIMSDWIYSIYRHKANTDLIKAMDKMIYSWLLYIYYYSVKRQNKQLYGFKIALDTNMLAYLLNINGKERKMYVEYLLNKIKRNNCTIIINEFTINELKHLVSNTDIPAIQIFRNENNTTIQQIIHNSEGFFLSLFENYGLKLIINN